MFIIFAYFRWKNDINELIYFVKIFDLEALFQSELSSNGISRILLSCWANFVQFETNWSLQSYLIFHLKSSFISFSIAWFFFETRFKVLNLAIKFSQPYFKAVFKKKMFPMASRFPQFVKITPFFVWTSPSNLNIEHETKIN